MYGNKHLSVNIGRITITILRENKNRLISLLSDIVSDEQFYQGWICEENPSPCKIGFALWFDENKNQIYADFHNVPFFYKGDYQGYISRISEHVTKHPEFKNWKDHVRFHPNLLRVFVSLLNELEGLEGGFIEEDQNVFHAHINFDDEFYNVLRVIDGDTIVVAPPADLKHRMKDIHVRLYGLETPELWEEKGEEYRQHLENLCKVDANNRVMIAWERERLNTNYEGYPQTSFERSIGHVFFKSPDDDFYYINGLMNILQESTLTRKGVILLRGSYFIDKANIELPWTGCCQNDLSVSPSGPSSTFEMLKKINPPKCLLAFRKVPNLDPREKRIYPDMNSGLFVIPKRNCPFDETLKRNDDKLRSLINEQRISPFDLPLFLVSLWSEKIKKRIA